MHIPGICCAGLLAGVRMYHLVISGPLLSFELHLCTFWVVFLIAGCMIAGVMYINLLLDNRGYRRSYKPGAGYPA